MVVTPAALPLCVGKSSRGECQYLVFRKTLTGQSSSRNSIKYRSHDFIRTPHYSHDWNIWALFILHESLKLGLKQILQFYSQKQGAFKSPRFEQKEMSTRLIDASFLAVLGLQAVYRSVLSVMHWSCISVPKQQQQQQRGGWVEWVASGDVHENR